MQVDSLLACMLTSCLAACGGQSIELDKRHEGGPASADSATFLANQDMARSVLVDDTRVYWTTAMLSEPGPSSRGSLRSCLKDACADSIITYSTRAYEVGRPTPDEPFLAVALDAQVIYWMQYEEGSFESIRSCPVTGCKTPSIVVPEVYGSGALAVRDGYVYWISLVDDALLRCPVAGCSVPTPVALGVKGGIEAALAVDEQYVYWASGPALQRVKNDGSRAPETLGAVPDGISRSSLALTLTINDTHIFCAQQYEGRIFSCPLSGCDSATLLSDKEVMPTALFADAEHAYWISAPQAGEPRLGTLRGIELGGGEGAVDVHQAQNLFEVSPQAIASDATHVYWVASGLPNDDGGFRQATIFRQPK